MALSRAGRSGVTSSTSSKKSRSLQDTSGLPGPVTGLSASSITSTSMSLSWSAPVISGDSSITSYIVTGGGTAVVTGTTASISGLSVNTSYTFTVVANNSIGAGVRSNITVSTLSFNSATGGTTTDVSNYNGTGQTWRVHQFSSNGTLNVTSAGSPFRVLMVGGGGSGGGPVGFGQGGGGGSGGVVFRESQTLSAQSYSIVVGGAGSNTNTTAFSLTALAGGAGNGGSGGSGAGGHGGHSGSCCGPTGPVQAGGAALQPTSASGGFGNPGASGVDDPGTWYGAGGAGGSANYSSNITGASVSYGFGGAGGGPNQNAINSGAPGGAGTVIVAYRIA